MSEPAVERIALDRPLRICDVCAQIDDHPRHVHGTADGATPVNQASLARVYADPSLDEPTRERIVADILDTSTQTRHLDCCRSAGCPDDSCNDLPAVTGSALLAHIKGAGA